MNQTLRISQTGLKGLQHHLDRVASNVANVNTTGYKKKDTAFQELLLNDVQASQVGISQGTEMGINRGLKTEQNSLNVSQGGLVKGSGPYDLAITGQGFFGVRGADNQLALTRDGAFRLDEGGKLRNSQGDALEIEYQLPQNQWPAGTPMIRENGDIYIGTQPVGKVLLFQVNNPGQLVDLGGNQFGVPAGMMLQSSRNGGDFGQIQQGFLETSNVDLAEAMTDMIVTQRAYSLNGKVLQATDEMMQRINEFKQ